MHLYLNLTNDGVKSFAENAKLVKVGSNDYKINYSNHNFSIDETIKGLRDISQKDSFTPEKRNLLLRSCEVVSNLIAQHDKKINKHFLSWIVDSVSRSFGFSMDRKYVIGKLFKFCFINEEKTKLKFKGLNMRQIIRSWESLTKKSYYTELQKYLSSPQFAAFEFYAKLMDGCQKITVKEGDKDITINLTPYYTSARPAGCHEAQNFLKGYLVAISDNCSDELEKNIKEVRKLYNNWRKSNIRAEIESAGLDAMSHWN